MFEKDYWPTAKKIQKLRDVGVLPYSKIIGALLSLGIIFIVIAFWKDDLIKTLNLKEFLKIKTIDELKQNLKVAVNFIVSLLSILAFVIIVSGVFQNRFYFQLSQIGINLKRLWFNRRINLINHIFRVILSFLFSIILIYVSIFIAYPFLVRLLRVVPHEFKELELININNYLSIGLLVWIVSLVLVVVATRFFYYYNNRMTKAEADRDKVD
jgi:flagellar biosynthesis protein FlhB